MTDVATWGPLRGFTPSVGPGTLQLTIGPGTLTSGSTSIFQDAGTTLSFSPNAGPDPRVDVVAYGIQSPATLGWVVLEGWLGSLGALKDIGYIGVFHVVVQALATSIDLADIVETQTATTLTPVQSLYARPTLSILMTYNPTSHAAGNPGQPGGLAFDTTSWTTITKMWLDNSDYNQTTFLRDPGAGNSPWPPLTPLGTVRIWSVSQPSYWITFTLGSVVYHAGPPAYVECGLSNGASSNSSLGAIPWLAIPGDLVVEVMRPASSSGTLIKRTVYTTGSSATHTFDTSATHFRAVGVGQGGGGGGASTNAGTNRVSVAGGGGGGGMFDVYAAISGTTGTYTVGTAAGGGGTGGTTGGDGSAGSNTTFLHNSITYTANGGSQGIGGGTGGTVATAHNGGAGGSASNGDINSQGQPGETGFAINVTLGIAGNGGCSHEGGGGQGVSQSGEGTTAGTNGVYGGGGGGAVAVRVAGANQANAGGNGGNGILIIEEYT